ncbi:hypothetical protein HI914_06289 [Erysiphe necator]|nr:hypothetical protein HI914_06289 [Erysiphe necator]
MLPFSILYSGLFLLYLSSRPTYSPHNAYKFFAEATPVEATENQNDNIGYECGDIFFTDKEANEVVSRCMDRMGQQQYFPDEYRGPLVNDKDSKKYFIWPVAKEKKIYTNKYNTGIFYVLFTENYELVDILARTLNSQFAKCIRRDGSQMELSSASDATNGYQCAHEFFSDEMLQDALQIAQKTTGSNLVYPAIYRGNLFPGNDEYKIWPLLRYGKLYRSGSTNVGIYFIIYDKQGELKDVIVRSYHHNALRCFRTRKAPKAPATDPLNRLFVPAPKHGYMCGKEFFEDDYLQQVAELAKSISSEDDYKSPSRKARYPKKCDGQPFYRPYLLFPIMRLGKMHGKGSNGVYRVALEINHKVICAAMVINGKVLPCEKATIKGSIQHDTSDYLCGNQVFPNKFLISITEKACSELRSHSYNVYPSVYQGPNFESPGPYFTYPISKKNSARTRVGPHRAVLNVSCEFVGALTTVLHNSESRLVKCHRLKNDPNAKSMPIDISENISEFRVQYG